MSTEIADEIEKIVAAALNHAIGNSQPHMSGDPRARLRPHWLRIVQDAAVSIDEALRRSSPLSDREALKEKIKAAIESMRTGWHRDELVAKLLPLIEAEMAVLRDIWDAALRKAEEEIRAETARADVAEERLAELEHDVERWRREWSAMRDSADRLHIRAELAEKRLAELVPEDLRALIRNMDTAPDGPTARLVHETLNSSLAFVRSLLGGHNAG